MEARGLWNTGSNPVLVTVLLLSMLYNWIWQNGWQECPNTFVNHCVISRAKLLSWLI
jgi:hypothetical protein